MTRRKHLPRFFCKLRLFLWITRDDNYYRLLLNYLSHILEGFLSKYNIGFQLKNCWMQFCFYFSLKGVFIRKIADHSSGPHDVGDAWNWEGMHRNARTHPQTTRTSAQIWCNLLKKGALLFPIAGHPHNMYLTQQQTVPLVKCAFHFCCYIYL